MAIYHFTAKAVSMGSGESAVHRAAYHARTQLDDERNDKTTRDYAHKGDLAWSGIFAPKDAPAWTKDRAQLWNAAERAERQANGQPARNIEFALPNELTRLQQTQLLTDFAREQFARKGMVADMCLHSDYDAQGQRRPGVRPDEPRNDHVHVLLSMRRIEDGSFKKTKTDAREWNSKEQLLAWRENWATAGTKALRKAGHGVEADRFAVGHLTLPLQRQAALDRGDNAWADRLDREPGLKQGAVVTQMEERGRSTERGDKARAIVERNGERAELVAESRVIDLELDQLKRDVVGEKALQSVFNDAAANAATARQQRHQTQVDRKSADTIRQALDTRYQTQRASQNAAYQKRQEEIRQHRADHQAGRDGIYGRYATALDAIWKPDQDTRTISPDRSAWNRVRDVLAAREDSFMKREGTRFGQVLNAFDLARGGKSRWADIFGLAFDAGERRRRFDRQQRIVTAKLAPPRPVRDGTAGSVQPRPTPEPRKVQAERVKAMRTTDLVAHTKEGKAREASMQARHQFQRKAEQAEQEGFKLDAKRAWDDHRQAGATRRDTLSRPDPTLKRGSPVDRQNGTVPPTDDKRPNLPKEGDKDQSGRAGASTPSAAPQRSNLAASDDDQAARAAAMKAERAARDARHRDQDRGRGR